MGPGEDAADGSSGALPPTGRCLPSQQGSHLRSWPHGTQKMEWWHFKIITKYFCFPHQLSAQTARTREFSSSGLNQDISRLKTVQVGIPLLPPPQFLAGSRIIYPFIVVLLRTTQGSIMELAQNLNQNDIWSCSAPSAVRQAWEREVDSEHPAPNTMGGGKRRAIQITTTALGMAKPRGFLLLLVKIK